MTFDEMITHCRKGGKARRGSWTSRSTVFVEGMRLGSRTYAVGGEMIVGEYHATIIDKRALDWEPA